MFAHSYSKLSRTCYGESTPYAPQKSSVLRWLQKHDDVEEKLRTAAGREFQAVGPQTVLQTLTLSKTLFSHCVAFAVSWLKDSVI